MMRCLLPLLIALGCPLPAIAQTPPPAPVEAPAPTPAPEFAARVKQLGDILAGKGDYAGFFSPEFIAQIPKTTFDQVNIQLTATYGPFVAVESVEARSPWAGQVRAQYRDAVLLLGIAVDPAGEHRVTGLRVLGPAVAETTPAAVGQALQGLHGTTGYVLARLGSGAPQIAAAHNADRPFAIGSEFKLVILAELIRATNAGERRWDDLVTLDGKELPAGGFTAKPAGTRVSLGELATQMISVSDNSATDILLKTLGRRRVEAMLPVVGIAAPARNRPFLSTAEVFKLKTMPTLRTRYLAADKRGRRALLDGPVAATPLGQTYIAAFSAGKPLSIEQLEWFMSPSDLVRVMDWIRRNTDGPRGATARAILSKNPGVSPAVAAKWGYVGYKGGSEPGVIAMTMLLQAKGGDWYVYSASWNDPERSLEEGRFAGLVSKAVELAAP